MTLKNLAIFDLDHTLILGDSEVEWSTFLAEKGLLSAADLRQGEAFYQDYLDGKLDIAAFLRFQLAPLARYCRQELDALHQDYLRTKIQPLITASARQLVNKHHDAGDDVLMISATNEFIITPIAQCFGIDEVIGVSLATDATGRYTGEPCGVLSFQEGKITRLNEWLSAQGKTRQDYAKLYFYSDSHNDLPLLLDVDFPVAVNPDATLEAYAQQQAWPIIHFSH